MAGVVLSRRGFTLAEIMVSVAVFSTAIVSLLYLFSGSVQMNDASRHISMAVEHGESVLEEIRSATPLEALSGLGSGRWALNIDAITAKGLMPLKDETITTNVSGEDLYTVTVTVAWSGMLGRRRSLTLTTIIGGV